MAAERQRGLREHVEALHPRIVTTADRGLPQAIGRPQVASHPCLDRWLVGGQCGHAAESGHHTGLRMTAGARDRGPVSAHATAALGPRWVPRPRSFAIGPRRPPMAAPAPPGEGPGRRARPGAGRHAPAGEVATRRAVGRGLGQAVEHRHVSRDAQLAPSNACEAVAQLAHVAAHHAVAQLITCRERR